MKYELKLKIKNNGKLIKKILEPELNQINQHRSKTNYKTKKEELTINVESNDLNSLRATINSHILWLKTINGVIENENTA